MSSVRPMHWHHFQANLIWWDGPFNNLFLNILKIFGGFSFVFVGMTYLKRKWRKNLSVIGGTPDPPPPTARWQLSDRRVPHSAPHIGNYTQFPHTLAEIAPHIEINTLFKISSHIGNYTLAEITPGYGKTQFPRSSPSCLLKLENIYNFHVYR